MKFGIFTIVPWHESIPQEQALREAMEQIELADQLGMDEVWLGDLLVTSNGQDSDGWREEGVGRLMPCGLRV